MTLCLLYVSCPLYPWTHTKPNHNIDGVDDLQPQPITEEVQVIARCWEGGEAQVATPCSCRWPHTHADMGITIWI